MKSEMEKEKVAFQNSENYQTEFHCHIVQIGIFQQQQEADRRPWYYVFTVLAA